MKTRSLFLIGLALAAVSCGPEPAGTRKVAEIVTKMQSSPLLPETSILKRYGSADRNSCITLAGQPEECMLLCGELLNSDQRDNYSGAIGADGLKDFSGEIVSCIMNADAVQLPAPDDSVAVETLRENNVRLVLAALDTLCFLTDFDRDGKGIKSHPKIIVMVSSSAAEYGIFDVDSLMSSFGAGVYVFNPLDVAIEDALLAGARNIGVIGTEEMVSSGIYESVLRNKCKELKIADADCFSFSPASGDNALVSFLNEYISAGKTAPVDVLIYDSYSTIGFDETNTLLKIGSALSDESVLYADFLGKNFTMTSLRDVAGRKCYDYLRGKNLFTHNISLPAAESFSARRDTSTTSGWRLENYRKTMTGCSR